MAFLLTSHTFICGSLKEDDYSAVMLHDRVCFIATNTVNVSFSVTGTKRKLSLFDIFPFLATISSTVNI